MRAFVRRVVSWLLRPFVRPPERHVPLGAEGMIWRTLDQHDGFEK